MVLSLLLLSLFPSHMSGICAPAAGRQDLRKRSATKRMMRLVVPRTKRVLDCGCVQKVARAKQATTAE